MIKCSKCGSENTIKCVNCYTVQDPTTAEMLLELVENGWSVQIASNNRGGFLSEGNGIIPWGINGKTLPEAITAAYKAMKEER